MGKKKNSPSQQHQTHSFAQLVGKANQEALKPYILQVFGNLADDLSQRVFVKLGIFQNRVEALETLLKKRLNITQEEIESELFDLEDRITGYQKVDRTTQEGDLLRLTMRIKNSKTGYGKPQKKEFSNLGKPPFALGLPLFEKALLGVAVGDPIIVPFDEDLKKQTGTDEIEFVIDRVSELIEKPKEPKKEETSNAEGQDAPQSSGSPEVGQTEPQS